MRARLFMLEDGLMQWLDEHLREIRAISVYGPIFGIGILIANSALFKRIHTIKELNRGKVFTVFVADTKGHTALALHSPILRRIFGLQPRRLHLSDLIPLKIPGVIGDISPLCRAYYTVVILEVKESHAECLMYPYSFIPRKFQSDVGYTLLKKGYLRVDYNLQSPLKTRYIKAQRSAQWRGSGQWPKKSLLTRLRVYWFKDRQ